eukprot:evm.model.scf_551.6 EVM.evm.TU.scf_551.6   scf_551:63752-64760(+)
MTSRILGVCRRDAVALAALLAVICSARRSVGMPVFWPNLQGLCVYRVGTMAAHRIHPSPQAISEGRSCLDHPNRGFADHRDPVYDLSMSITTEPATPNPIKAEIPDLEEDVLPQAPFFCPGDALRVAVSFFDGSSRMGMITASGGRFEGEGVTCRGRRVDWLEQVAGHEVVWRAGCGVGEEVVFKVTSGTGPSSEYLWNELAVGIGEGCWGGGGTAPAPAPECDEL